MIARVVTLLALLAMPRGLGAQAPTSALSGRILDVAGAPITSARLRIPQLERADGVDSTGRFHLDSLPIGRYTVVAEAPGYYGIRRELTFTTGAHAPESFVLSANSHILAAVEIRARSRPQLPPQLQEFALRRDRGLGRFLDPEQLARFDGQQLSEALKPILGGARFQRTAQGDLTLVSSRSINVQTSLNASSTNVKPCGVQVWQDGVLVSDPNSSAEIAMQPSATSRQVATVHIGADKEMDVFGLLANNYMAAEYYPDLATTPPGFRTGTASCGVLVLWSRVSTRRPAQ